MEKTMGNYIRDYCFKNNISLIKLAQQLKLSDSGLYRSLHAKQIPVSRVIQISQILNHNFFEDCYPSALNPGDSPSPLITENQLLKQKVTHLETELTAYRDMISLLKSKSV
jgi:hypothetical protein